jgi:tRNA(fMet)-specific endonuclease VapC
MRRYLLDTNTASDFVAKRGDVPARAKETRLRGGKIGVAIPVLTELYYGFEYSSSRELNLSKLGHAIDELRVWPFDLAAAAEYGRLRAELRRRGRAMQQIDVMIASIALTFATARSFHPTATWRRYLD